MVGWSNQPQRLARLPGRPVESALSVETSVETSVEESSCAFSGVIAADEEEAAAEHGRRHGGARTGERRSGLRGRVVIVDGTARVRVLQGDGRAVNLVDEVSIDESRPCCAAPPRARSHSPPRCASARHRHTPCGRSHAGARHRSSITMVRSSSRGSISGDWSQVSMGSELMRPCLSICSQNPFLLLYLCVRRVVGNG